MVVKMDSPKTWGNDYLVVRRETPKGRQVGALLSAFGLVVFVADANGGYDVDRSPRLGYRNLQALVLAGWRPWLR